MPIYLSRFYVPPLASKLRGEGMADLVLEMVLARLVLPPGAPAEQLDDERCIHLFRVQQVLFTDVRSISGRYAPDRSASINCARASLKPIRLSPQLYGKRRAFASVLCALVGRRVAVQPVWTKK